MPALLDGELITLPDGKAYESTDEADGPTGDILEEDQLVGVEERCPNAAEQPRAGSPTRQTLVTTNSLSGG